MVFLIIKTFDGMLPHAYLNHHKNNCRISSISKEFATAHPAYGAKYCNGADSDAVAATIIVFANAPLFLKTSTN